MVSIWQKQALRQQYKKKQGFVRDFFHGILQFFDGFIIRDFETGRKSSAGKNEKM